MYLVDVCYDAFTHIFKFDEEIQAHGFVIAALEQGYVLWESKGKSIIVPLHRIKCFEIYQKEEK